MEGTPRAMALTLNDLQTRVSRMLMDTGEDIWPETILDEAIRQALSTYSQVFPCLNSAEIATPSSGDIDLGNLPGLSAVVAVRWPYETGKTEALQPVNRVTGWRCWREMDQPILELRIAGGLCPASGEMVFVRYTTGHTVNGLDDEETTTVPAAHNALIVHGAAGYAALFRAVDKVENRSYGSRRTEPSLLQRWAETVLDHFNRDLDGLRRQRLPFTGTTRWRMDPWDIR